MGQLAEISWMIQEPVSQAAFARMDLRFMRTALVFTQKIASVLKVESSTIPVKFHHRIAPGMSLEGGCVFRAAF